MHESLRVNGSRLERRLEELARIGALESGGVCRLAFSPADKAGRNYVEGRMRSLGLEVRIDAIGNLMGIRPGREPGPVAVCGSHTDTVGTGGRYDGATGVLAGLEVMETLNEAGITTQRPLAVISFVNEEGARFMPDMMGSLFVRGDLGIGQARAVIGIDGTSVGSNLDDDTFPGSDDFHGFSFGSYLELHIEQGPVLESEGIQIGVVEGVQGIRWIELNLEGAAAHAGATPIEMRRDAGYVAGAIAQYARRLSLEIDAQRATVGFLSLYPNLVNVVAEQARLTVDLRNPDSARLGEAERRLHDFVEQTAALERVRVRSEKRVDVAPVVFDARIVGIVEAKARVLGVSSRRMISGAGHDAQIMAGLCPAAMIFVPSSGGISHNVREYTSAADIECGANVLLHTLLELGASNSGTDHAKFMQFNGLTSF